MPFHRDVRRGLSPLSTPHVKRHCASKCPLQRLLQLQALHKSLTGEQPVTWPMSNL